MSAYMVDREHIAYLIQAAMSRVILHGDSKFRWRFDDSWKEPDPYNHEAVAAAGQMLWDENFASVTRRYPSDDFDNLPGPIGENFVYAHHAHSPYISIDPVQVMKSCDCYTYQSCEHEGWESSEARQFILRLRDAASKLVKGYDDAEWGAPKCAYVTGKR